MKGNFKTLKKLAQLPIPLPLGGIKNVRSFISVGNLVDLLIYCLKNTSQCFNQTLLASDGSDYSTTELLKKLGKSKYMLLPLPQTISKFIFSALNKKNQYAKLFQSLSIDKTQMQKIVNWRANPEKRL